MSTEMMLEQSLTRSEHPQSRENTAPNPQRPINSKN